MARCMLVEADLPKSLWGEAVNTAAFIRNRCPSSAIENKTPFELWYGRKPNVSFFRTFGSKVIALEKGPNRSKLDAKGKEYTFVGYCEESKAYRLWNGNRSIVKRRDVKFFEKVDLNNYLFLEAPYPGSVSVVPNDELYCNGNALKPVQGINSKADQGAEYENKNNDDTEENDEETCNMSNYSDEPDFEGLPDEEIQAVSENEFQTCDENSGPPPRRRGRPRILRTGKPGRPKKDYSHKINLVESDVHNNPVSFEAAMNSDLKTKWIEAMKTELNSLEKNNTWKIVDRPKDRKVLSNRWVFCVKNSNDGLGIKYKARLVARGCEQESGIDYDEVYAPVARYETIRTLFALCAEHELYLHQMDVVTAYVQGELEDEIYMEQPQYPLSKADSRKVCKLLKPLYGLKQAGRQWHMKLDTYLKTLGMKQTSADKCLYVNHINGKVIIILVYVDDLLLASNCLKLLNKTKEELSAQFEMKDLGEANNILGITVRRNSARGEIEINQRKYIERLLEKFKMNNANAVATPLDTNLKLLLTNDSLHEDEMAEMDNKPYRELIGGLTYLSNTVRPDIAFSVNLLARFCTKPRITHWNAAKRILRYLKGTMNYNIKYRKSDKDSICYVDADWANDVQDRKSCSGYVIMIGGGPTHWKSKKQRSVALSTMEAEYIALSEVSKEVVYLRKLVSELGFTSYCERATIIHCDNQSAIKFSKDNAHHEKSKHVDIRYHFCKELQEEGIIKVMYIPSENMPADMLTKGLTKLKHGNCVKMLNLLN